MKLPFSINKYQRFITQKPLNGLPSLEAITLNRQTMALSYWFLGCGSETGVGRCWALALVEYLQTIPALIKSSTNYVFIISLLHLPWVAYNCILRLNFEIFTIIFCLCSDDAIETAVPLYSNCEETLTAKQRYAFPSPLYVICEVFKLN